MLYYQFDRDEFRAGHYQEGYFSYEKDGFGPVAETEEELLGELEKCLQRNALPSSGYQNRMKSFFVMRDRKNCERNLDAIMQIAEEGKDR